MKKIFFLLPLAIFLLILFVFKIGLGKDPNLLPSLLVDKPLPAFSATSLQDNNVQITNDQLKGKLVLLNVWATWCSACQIEHPLLVDLAKEQQVEIVGLNYKDERNAALQYLDHVGNPYQKIIFDPQGKIALQFGVYGTPETFLVDKKGVVRYRYVGPMTLSIVEKDLVPRIKALTKE